jgi:DNA polymerase
MILHIDFETRSAADLKRVGAHAYAEDPSTDALCLGWCVGDGPIEIWKMGEPLPGAIEDAILAGDTFVAHNAAFELAIWNRTMAPRYGWPPLDPRQTRCTMAMAMAMSLPASLENAAAAVGLEVRKDLDGRRLMLQTAKPRAVLAGGTVSWWMDAARLERLHDYCRQDVEVERHLQKKLLGLTPPEQALWALDMAINDRGFQVDVRTVDRLIKSVEKEKARLDRRMAVATGGRVMTCNQVMELESWVKCQGVDCDGLAKADIVAMLERPDLPPAVRTALRIRQEGAKSSTAKLKAMRDSACADGRVRGALQYHAAGTGRWGGRRVQPQNFPRPGLSQDQIEEVVALFS